MNLVTPSQVTLKESHMHKLISYIPNHFDIQYDPRLDGEPMFFAMWGDTLTWDCLTIRIAAFKVFIEYVKG